MPKLKSQNPKPYDHTEEDLIMVPPAVLDNKLRDFEEHFKFRSAIGGDIAFALALIIPVITATFNDHVGVSGSTIRGVFIAGFIYALARVIRDVYRILQTDGHARKDLINSLRQVKKEIGKEK